MKPAKWTSHHPGPPRIPFSIRLFGMLFVCLLCPGFPPFVDTAAAQDLAVDWVTVTPDEGAAGDTVTLQGRIVNNGPGDNYSFLYRRGRK
jgi:hypothetical protein